LLLAALGGPEAQAQQRGLTPLNGAIGSIGSGAGSITSGVGTGVGSITSGVGSGGNSITSGVGSGIGQIGATNPGAGFFPGNTDLSVSGTVGVITNAVPIEGLYDGVSNAVTNTIKRTTTTIGNGIGNPKDPLAKGAPGAQPRASRAPPAGEQRFVAFEVLVGLPSNLTQQALNALARQHRLVRLESQSIGLTNTTLHR
jgi:hypothetical protein